ncbi:hypothetical protein NPS70_01940 [Streptomyces sp. C10-9-1]|uniref:hypothetical protein n=1 Tax=Streptomyces sp. C10-9-1 TaxID=1859285 RepID=UPI00211260E3|nr:hypothetical protein [Streptomyces sp. C10-9-1]MCQ6551968.1 hypothetical protein [Streptomyces sp. C10-9-1]
MAQPTRTVPLILTFVVGHTDTGRTAAPLVAHSGALELARPETGEAVREVVCADPACRQRLRVRVRGLAETRSRRRALWGWAAAAGSLSAASWFLAAGLLGTAPAVLLGLAGTALAASALVLACTAHAYPGVGRPQPVPAGSEDGGRHVVLGPGRRGPP